MKMEFEVKEVKSIEEGKHIGKITRVEYRTEPFEYTDVYVKLDDSDIELKIGYPSFVSTGSQLGKLLAEFGSELVKGSKVSPEDVLVGRACEFMTLDDKTDRGTFAVIVKGSLRPVKPAEDKPLDVATE